MAKRKPNAPVVMDKRKFLLPRMEFFPLDEATGEGFYLRELGGKSLLEWKELLDQIKKAAGQDAELTTAQGIELMAKFVVLSACDADGNPLFTEDDVALLSEKSPNLLLDICNRAMPLSGMNPVVLTGDSNLKNDQDSASSTN